MTTWVALFRGINVGGNNVLPMTELRSLLEGIACSQVRTYIQSGNVVFEKKTTKAPALSSLISKTVASAKGFEPKVFLLTAEELKKALAANPFPAAVAEPKSLHLFFLAAKPDRASLKAIDELKAGSEEYRLIGRTFYLYAPEGIGRSKLAAKAEKTLGVDVTARNWRTASKLVALLNQT